MTFGNAEVEVYLHSPGSTRSAFYDYDELEIAEGEQIVTKIIHEMFEVLDFGNERCMVYEEQQGQDACLDALIFKVNYHNFKEPIQKCYLFRKLWKKWAALRRMVVTNPTSVPIPIKVPELLESTKVSFLTIGLRL